MKTTERGFWRLFRLAVKKNPDNFRIGSGGSYCWKDVCPVAAVANLREREVRWACLHSKAAEAIGLDVNFAREVAHAADAWTDADPTIRMKLLKIISEVQSAA